MKWIEFNEDRGAFKKGQRIEKEDGAADTLIELGVAKACEAPAPTADDEARKTLGTVIQTTVVDEFTKLRKELTTRNARIVEQADDEHTYTLGTAKKFVLPANVKRYSSLRHFKGESGGKSAEERAYRFGMWCMANYAMNGRIDDPERRDYMMRSVKRCKEMNVPITFSYMPPDEAEVKALVGGGATKASNENVNTSSGYLVPDEFQNDLIDLREKYGVFRQNAKIIPMSSDTRSDPRRVGGLTPYFVGESKAGTESTKTWDRVRLTAKKLMVLTKYSNELNEDSVLSLADDLASEIAYTFANKEDQCGFNGDGTSTYGGIRGVRAMLKAVDGTVGNVLGLTVATGTGYASSYGSIVLGDFNKVVATLPEFADVPGETAWYCSKFFWGSVMQKLAAAAGGNRIADINTGALKKEFLGYPVVISQVLPKTPAINQVVCLFGNMRQAASLGDRRMTTLAISDVALNSFEQDEIAIRGTERFDINVHDVGESSAGTARDSVNGLSAGPIVGLITAAS
jgi:HK97 family phage major capsid protein